MSKRKLKNWLEGFEKATENTEPPTIFRKWVGISTVASAMERKVFTQWEFPIYPNLYIVLVGPSACRKSTAMGYGRRLLNFLPINIAANATTREALIKALNIVNQEIQLENGQSCRHSSITVNASELAVFLGDSNYQLMSDLTDWFDSGEIWRYETKNKGVDEIHGVWVNILGATTPMLVQKSLPSLTIGGGLTSRMIFIFAHKKEKNIAFPQFTPEQEKLFKDLTHDLQLINMLQGQFTMTKDFAEEYAAWYESGETGPTAMDPDHFDGYIGRRALHLRKLCMIFSAAKRDTLILEKEDFVDALDYLVEAELQMLNVFRGYGRLETSEIGQRILRQLVENKGKITYKEILVRFYNDATIPEIDELLTTLATIDYIKIKNEDGQKVIEANTEVLDHDLGETPTSAE